MFPLVCIILVNYNGYEDTIDCIKSLLNIDYDNFKIIVIDNGSTKLCDEKSEKYIFENTEYIKVESNIGFSGGNNIGIKYAQRYNPDYFLLLNNDTVVEPNFLNELVNLKDYSTDIGIICGRIKFYDMPDKLWYAGGEINYKTGKTIHTGYMQADSQELIKNRFVSFATGCLMLLPKETISRVGLLNEEYFLYCEDTDYCFRVLSEELKILYCGRSCIYHKVSASTGKGSDLQSYYLVRNALILTEKYINMGFKVKVYYFIKYFKLIILGKVKLRTAKEAIYDFYNHKTGKRG